MKGLISKSKFIKKNVFNQISDNKILVFFKKYKGLNFDLFLNLNFYFKLNLYFLTKNFRNKFFTYGNVYFVSFDSQAKCLQYLNLLRKNNIFFSFFKLGSQFFRNNFIFENISFYNFFLNTFSFLIFFFFNLMKKFFSIFYNYIYNLNAYSISIVK